MKICLTGYKGFIGSHLGMQLAKEGHEVIGFPWQNYNHFPDPSLYDWVIHLGAISSTTERNVDKILKHNLEYSMKLSDIDNNGYIIYGWLFVRKAQVCYSYSVFLWP